MLCPPRLFMFFAIYLRKAEKCIYIENRVGIGRSELENISISLHNPISCI